MNEKTLVDFAGAPITNAYADRLARDKVPARVRAVVMTDRACTLERDRAALVAALEAVFREAVTLRQFDKMPSLLSESTTGIVRATLARIGGA